MKRLVTLLVTALLMTAALCVSASAADYTSAAEELSAIGMFRGTVNGGFELDRAPKRSEAAIMLVRLYGAEDEAAAAYQNGEISHPFQDVGEIASPYVAWLYTKGITKGTTATTFSSNTPCTDKNYVVFLLRALGYEDGTDFQYTDALTFAAGLGFYDATLFEGTFLRNDLAAITLQALAADKKGGETYLLKSLIDSGAVKADKAKALTGKIEAYRALAAQAATVLETNAFSARFTGAVTVNSLLTSREDGEDYRVESSVSLTPTGSVSFIEEPLQAAFDAKLAMKLTEDGTTSNTTTSIQLWLKDNWVYLRTDDGAGTTTNQKQDISEYKDILLETLAQVTAERDDPAASVSYAPLLMVDAITVKTVGTDKVYTLSVDRYFADLIGGGDSTITDEDGTVYTDKLNDAQLDLSLTFSGNGILKSVAVDSIYDNDTSVKLDKDNYENNSTKVHVQFTFTTGSSVSIRYPDLSQFVEVDTEESTSEPAESTTTPASGSSSQPSSGSTTKPSTSTSKPSTAQNPQPRTVYVTETGKRYHYSSTCNGGTYYASTLQAALARGLTPCQKCVL